MLEKTIKTIIAIFGLLGVVATALWQAGMILWRVGVLNE
jgi:hypothetical protein